MRINYNVSAMLTNNALKRNDAKLSTALERLSSGYKINNAKDNPAGLAISRRMNAQIRGLDIAGDNTTSGISVIEIADGALNEVHDILQRMNELAVKGAHEILTDNDRKMIDEEFQALKDEIQRISDTTQFNGQNLLDGSFDMKGYTNNEAVKIDYYDEMVPYGKYTMDITPTWDAEGKLTDGTTVTLEDKYGNDLSAEITVEVYNDEVTLTAAKDFEIRMTLAQGTGALTDVELDITGMGALTLQVGSNEGHTMEVKIPAMNIKNLRLTHTDTLTPEGATQAINDVKFAIQFTSSARSSLGAYQNRLEHTLTNLDLTGENMTSAYSRVMDTDMAEEMTNYSAYQIVSQAATTMLAQANERPAQVLQILQ